MKCCNIFCCSLFCKTIKNIDNILTLVLDEIKDVKRKYMEPLKLQ